ncbi:MAG: ATP-binding protein [Geobacteraceae bacterium]|nr:ATP-binding protein [Geobacteraceae bacterium]
MKIPFKVSARTARLIGRENVANAEGAIIELVKNAYDADAKFCLLYIDSKYETVPAEISDIEFNDLLKHKSCPPIMTSAYILVGDKYILSDTTEEEMGQLSKFIQSLQTLFIIDNGEGMSDSIIRDYWMTIGTNNKQRDILTYNGRVKAGEKGIGRFALDRLGGNCQMITVPNPKAHTIDAGVQGYEWTVSWSDFDGDGKCIEDVTANLETLKTVNFKEEVFEILSEQPHATSFLQHKKIEHGTKICIEDLRDHWNKYHVQRLFQNLEHLIPPKEERDFQIFVSASGSPEEFGIITASICDDFDYKVHAIADAEGSVKITIIRKEYDLRKINSEVFKRPRLQKEPYTEEIFRNEAFTTTRTLRQLVPGYGVIDDDKVLENIGPFEFTFYFMKKTMSKDDAKRFFYRDFNSFSRQKWLDAFGGIKIFRDNFRIRPYGEKGSNAEDWLSLGDRQAGSPAGIGKMSGGYRVRPYNVSGVITISRQTNVFFEDKSSREGLQETKEFDVFKQVILGIISVFEYDRSLIAREFDAYHKETNAAEILRKRAEEIAKKIREHKDEDKEKQTYEDPEKEILAAHTENQKEIIEELKEEQKLLRALASAGAIISSFAHELQNLNTKLVYRLDDLKSLITPFISDIQLKGLPKFKNPYICIDDIKKQDERLKHWLNFAINSVRKDKRRRKNLDLINYLQSFSLGWAPALSERHAFLTINHDNIVELNQRYFEIDLDCIFNNLLVNSLDAFQRKDATPERLINIGITDLDHSYKIVYSDSGPGLSKDIVNPDQIYDCFFTTKKHKQTGEDIGTGIGMWLVKTIVEENDGILELLYPEKGFSLSMTFKKKHKR